MDIIELLTIANKAGLGAGPIFCLIIIWLNLRKFVSKQNDELKYIVTSQVDKLVTAINKHNERLESLENDVQQIKQQLSKD